MDSEESDTIFVQRNTLTEYKPTFPGVDSTTEMMGPNFTASSLPTNRTSPTTGRAANTPLENTNTDDPDPDLQVNADNHDHHINDAPDDQPVPVNIPGISDQSHFSDITAKSCQSTQASSNPLNTVGLVLQTTNLTNDHHDNTFQTGTDSHVQTKTKDYGTGGVRKIMDLGKTTHCDPT